MLRSDARLSPFGDRARDAFFAGETVGDATARAFRSAGLEVRQDLHVAEARAALRRARGPVVVLPDHIYVSAKAAADFVRVAGDGPAALALAPNASVAWTRPLQGLRGDTAESIVHDVLLVPGGAAPDEAPLTAWLRSFEAPPVLVPKRELVVPVRVPSIGRAEAAVTEYPVTSTVVVAVHHWVHVLWLNQIAFGVRWMELIRRRPIWAIFRALTAFSFNRHRLLNRLVWARGADVHPSAYVSGSIIMPGARIGARATVKNSWVGPGVEIGDHAVLSNTVVGRNARIMADTVLVSCALYPEAEVGNLKLQVSLIGEAAYVDGWAGFVDAKFSGPIKVAHEGELRSTERSFLGSVVGHRARIAAKVLIQPGREIPNDAVVVMRPDEVVSEVPRDFPPGRPHVRHEGTLVPLGEERR